ncbi:MULTISPECIES: lysophospholipid acyltransferase family protein [Undibacterium]|uniref:Lysophospholipid acyltransferase family protein n=1 Tax=Undibacterium aquatile TaxID=1537398 RepID=A0ABR6XDM3_9BURK|nr:MULTISPECIES: lysophospholipid acyltransferase family protein [Undibacterium]MBC3810404.1 lysophospholipid acyltransferase family protein [Undibacterium aquatile]MBC3878152.1 lysophospholipid acyltransferase family protein [Undibacterium sp. FT79W]
MLVILFRFLSFFPLSVLHLIGAVLGRIVYLLSGSYRRRLRENLERAGFSAHLSDAVKEAGKNILELPFIWCAKPDRVLRTASLENWDLVQQALDAKKGVIFLTPHLGCFEIVAQSIAVRTRLTVMYRPPRKDALKPLIEGARARENLLLAPANLSGVRIMAKALKKGEAIGLLPDQVPQEGEGVWAKFFGKPAYTMTLSAKLHSMNGAPIILTYAERLPHGRGYVVRFAAFEEELGSDPVQQAEAINRGMEKLIARSPAQYFWSYNRYKKPDGVSGPDTDVTEGQA